MKEEHHTMKKTKKLEHWKIIAAYLVIYDIIAVNGDPLTNPSCLGDVPFVMQNGQVVKH